MARPPRILLPHTVVFITSRIQQGIPFEATPLMERLLWSALAVACDNYPIRIIGFVIMGNHIHLMALVEDPQNIEGFMERFKCESAHAVNRLLGRRQVTVWCEGYDSPTVLTIPDIIKKLAYLYLNPVCADRCSSIDTYKGVSSWQMFQQGIKSRDVKRVRRPHVPLLPSGPIDEAMYERLAAEVDRLGTEELEFLLDPDAWMVAFPNECSKESFEKRVVDLIRKEEARLAQEREPAAQDANLQHSESLGIELNTTYLPKTFGRRMWCICGDIPLRIHFISFIKVLRTEALEVRKQWRLGNWREPFPPGLFPPTIPMLANLFAPYEYMTSSAT